MLRHVLFAVLLASPALIAGPAWAEKQPVELSVIEAHPGFSAQLPLGARFSVRLKYQSAQPVRFQLEAYEGGQKIRPSTSNIMPLYPSGEGEALVWFTLNKPAKVEEIRVTAFASRSQPLTSLSRPAQLEWSSTARRGFAAPEWFQRLSREQQELAARTASAPDPARNALGMAVIGIGGISILAYLALQPILLFTMRGRWRIAAFVPLIAVVPLVVQAAYAFAHASNLWPLGLLFLMPLAMLYLLLLCAVRALVSWRRQPPHGGTPR